MSHRNRSEPAPPPIDGKLQVYLGRRLRSAYDEVLVEGIPDRLKVLLEQLEQSETEQQTDRSHPSRYKADDANPL